MTFSNYDLLVSIRLSRLGIGQDRPSHSKSRHLAQYIGLMRFSDNVNDCSARD